MKQTIPFVKDIEFKNKIHEITAISLEHDLKMENDDSITGTFLISGKYKMNMISVNEDNFEEKLYFDITLDDKYDSSKVKIDIDDFYYEIINEEKLRVHINVLIDNLFYIKNQERCIEEENKPAKEDEEKIINNEEEMINNEVNIIPDIKKEEITNINDFNIIKDNDINITNINSNFLSKEEKYVTYKVHIIRDNENIETIKEKYKVTKEELEKYNDLENITLGTKIIIPINASDE